MSSVMQTDPDDIVADKETVGMPLLKMFLDPQVLAKISVVMGALVGLAMNLSPRFMCSLHCDANSGDLKQQFNN